MQLFFDEMARCLAEASPLETTHAIEGVFFTVLLAAVIIVVAIRLVGGRTKIEPEGNERVIECKYCHYYLVPSDTTCPKCYKPVDS